jgi:hypothetical protein
MDFSSDTTATLKTRDGSSDKSLQLQTYLHDAYFILVTASVV